MVDQVLRVGPRAVCAKEHSFCALLLQTGVLHFLVVLKALKNWNFVEAALLRILFNLFFQGIAVSLIPGLIV